MITDIVGVAKLPFTIRGTRMISCLRAAATYPQRLTHNICGSALAVIIIREMLVVKGTLRK